MQQSENLATGVGVRCVNICIEQDIGFFFFRVAQRFVAKEVPTGEVNAPFLGPREVSDEEEQPVRESSAGGRFPIGTQERASESIVVDRRLTAAGPRPRQAHQQILIGTSNPRRSRRSTYHSSSDLIALPSPFHNRCWGGEEGQFLKCGAQEQTK